VKLNYIFREFSIFRIQDPEEIAEANSPTGNILTFSSAKRRFVSGQAANSSRYSCMNEVRT